MTATWRRGGLLVLVLSVGATSCREKPDAAGGRSTGEAARQAPAGDEAGEEARDEAGEAAGKADAEEKAEPRKVGLGDFVDYAIGKKQMDIGNRLKTKIRKIEADYNKRLDDQMGD